MVNKMYGTPRVIGRLSVGLSAEVWKCAIDLPNRNAPLVAAMRIYQRPLDSEDNKPDLARLFEIVSLQDIAGVVRIWEISEWFGKLGVLMPIADGDGSQLIRGQAASEETLLNRIIPAVRQAAVTLDSLGERGLTHGSVAPQHILLYNDHAVITGFSLLHTADQPVPKPVRSDLMTCSCMSPEMQNGTSHRTSDQYSLAATYLAMRSGLLPFGDRSWPARYIAAMGREEARVLSRATAAFPGDRFPTCQAFIKELSGL
jgi:hypothetical protein